MRLTASDIFNLYRPTPCDLRIYLREHCVPEAEPVVFEQVLQKLGERHEQKHLATLGRYEDLSGVSPDERVQRTLEAVRNRAPVIYQGELACDTTLDGTRVTVVGRPDFLILDGDAYLIRDSKLSRKVDDKHHVEIALQLQLYGWLFGQVVGTPAKRLQVHAGGGDIIEVPYDGGAAALAGACPNLGDKAAGSRALRASRLDQVQRRLRVLRPLLEASRGTPRRVSRDGGRPASRTRIERRWSHIRHAATHEL